MSTIASEGKNIISLRSQVRLNTLKINRARKEQLKAQEALAKAQEDITRAQQEIAIAEERRSQAEEELKAIEKTTGEKHVVIFSTKGVGYDDQIQRKGKKRFVRWEGQKSHAQDYLVVDALGPVHFFQRNRRGKPFTYQGVVKKTSIQLLEPGTKKKTPNTYQFELETGVVPTGTIFSQVLRFNNKKDWHRTAAHGLGLNLEGYNSYFTRGIYETTFLQSTQTPPESDASADTSEADEASDSLTDENYDSEESDSSMEVFSEDVPRQRQFSKFFIFLVISILLVCAAVNMANKYCFDDWSNHRTRLVSSTLEWRDWASALMSKATLELKTRFYNTSGQNNTIIINTTCFGVTRHPSCLWSV